MSATGNISADADTTWSTTISFVLRRIPRWNAAVTCALPCTRSPTLGLDDAGAGAGGDIGEVHADGVVDVIRHQDLVAGRERERAQYRIGALRGVFDEGEAIWRDAERRSDRRRRRDDRRRQNVLEEGRWLRLHAGLPSEFRILDDARHGAVAAVIEMADARLEEPQRQQIASELHVVHTRTLGSRANGIRCRFASR